MKKNQFVVLLTWCALSVSVVLLLQHDGIRHMTQDMHESHEHHNYAKNDSVEIDCVSDNYFIVKRSRRRISQLEKFCEFHANMTKLFNGTNRVEEKLVVVDNQNKFLYFPLAKVASTVWKRIFARILLPEYQNLSRDQTYTISDPHHLNFTYLSLLPHREQSKMLNTYYKFVFVREPFERIVSAFKNKFMNANDNYFREIFGQLLTKHENTFASTVNPNTSATFDGVTYTFRSFVRYIVNENREKLNRHWAPMTDLLQPCLYKFDFIGKLETMAEDGDYIISCKLNEGRLSTFTPLYKPRIKINYVNNYYSSCGQSDVEKLYELFKFDFKLFGYKIPKVKMQE